MPERKDTEDRFDPSKEQPEPSAGIPPATQESTDVTRAERSHIWVWQPPPMSHSPTVRRD